MKEDRWEIIKLVKRLLPELKALGVTPKESVNMQKLTPASKVPATVPLIKAPIPTQLSGLRINLQISLEGWLFMVFFKSSEYIGLGADFERGNTDPVYYDNESKTIIELASAIGNGAISLVAHSREGHELIGQMYERKGDHHVLLGTKYAYSFKFPLVRKDALILKAYCDKVDVYSVSETSSSIGTHARKFIKSITYPTTLRSEVTVRDLDSIKPIDQEIVFLENQEESNDFHESVSIVVPLSSEYGSEQERGRIQELEEEIRAALSANNAGEFDGDEFGDGQCMLYIYGVDAKKIYKAVEPIMKASEFRPVEFTLQYSEDGQATEESLALT